MREPERDLGRLMDILQAAPSYSRVHSTSDAINQSKTLYLPAQLVGHIIRQFLAGGERFEGPDFLCCLAIDFAGTVTFVIGFATANGEHTDENPAKYNAMFERRAGKGQCFNQPYLGTRECAASFRLVNPVTDTLTPPIAESRDLGIMLYDMDFQSNPQKPEAMFYRAKMENGVIIVPPLDSEEILR